MSCVKVTFCVFYSLRMYVFYVHLLIIRLYCKDFSLLDFVASTVDEPSMRIPVLKSVLSDG